MRISDWSSDVCSSDLTGVCSASRPARKNSPPTITTTMSRRITSERDMATLVPTNRARTERGEVERPFARARASLYSPCRDDAKPVPQTSLEGRSEEKPYELQSLIRNSSAVFCLKKKRHKN